MQEIILRYPFKAVSFQQAKFGKHGMYKTAYQKEFEASVGMFLLSKRKELDLFGNCFNEGSDVITTKWIFTYKDFFTKKENTISSKTLDLDNSAKNFQDIVFKSIGINDKNIVYQEAIKWHGQDGIFLKIKSMKREEFETFLYK